MMRLPAVPRTAALVIAGSLAGALLALGLGFSPEWDLLNYHLYNPHALLTGRHAIDVAPAQMQTYLNPLFHLPHYLLFRFLGSEALVGVLGALQGAQLVLLWLLVRRLVRPVPVPPVIVLLVALLGLGGPVFLSELGVTQGDTLLSALVLGALILLLPGAARTDEAGLRRAGPAIAAGLLLGLATALKLVFGIYAAAALLALLLCPPGRARWRYALAFVAGGSIGFVVFGGPWFAWLWWAYDNPLFPYFNQLFQSDWAGHGSFRDLRFLPRSALEWVIYPLVWLAEPQRVWEWPFRDVRLVVLVPVAAAVLPAIRRLPPRLAFVCVFVVVSYLLWLVMFSIYRYLAVLEMLAPPVLFALLVQWRPRRGTVIAALAALLVSQAAVRYERPKPLWELRYDQPSRLADLPDDALVLITGYAPLGYAALWLDDGIPLVRVRANFLRPERSAPRLSEHAERRVSQHRGPLYLLQVPADTREPSFLEDLVRLDLVWDGGRSCEPVFEDDRLNRRLQVQLCPLERRSGRFQIAGR